jgi:DNA-binding MarR family transcriptional regulator
MTDLFNLGDDTALTPPVRAFRATLVLAQRLRHLMDERLRPDGLTTQQAALLTVVRKLGNPSLTETAAALGTTHQNAAQLVTALERKNMLESHPDPADRRRRRLTATDTSARYWTARDTGDEDAVATWFDTLTPDELHTYTTLTRRLLDHVAANPAPGNPTSGNSQGRPPGTT